MRYCDEPPDLQACQKAWDRCRFVPFGLLIKAATVLAGEGAFEPVLQRLWWAFNGSEASGLAIRQASLKGNPDATTLLVLQERRFPDHPPRRPLDAAEGAALEARLLADPAGFVAGLGPGQPYPCLTDEGAFAFCPDWAGTALARGQERFARFTAQRKSDVAVLVGNGPSLRKIDLGRLRGQDVFISNYAIRHPELRRLAKGVAVSNPLVAEQEPYRFQLNTLWKFHPLWLGHCLRDTPESIHLNALGGPLFFSRDVTRSIAWHSTVSFFWLQILYSAGYRRVLLIGIDNQYQQAAGLSEGTRITQSADDPNHFDPQYFKGKVWQAADTGRMAETYQLARQQFEATGREIVNCTVGGALDVFRRASLAAELARRTG